MSGPTVEMAVLLSAELTSLRAELEKQLAACVAELSSLRSDILVFALQPDSHAGRRCKAIAFIALKRLRTALHNQIRHLNGSPPSDIVYNIQRAVDDPIFMFNEFVSSSPVTEDCCTIS